MNIIFLGLIMVLWLCYLKEASAFRGTDKNIYTLTNKVSVFSPK